MQIDGHHAGTYITARLAGFSHEEAEIISYAAQYVDDATNEGAIQFDNPYMYSRIASAHSMIDYNTLSTSRTTSHGFPSIFYPEMDYCHSVIHHEEMKLSN